MDLGKLVLWLVCWLYMGLWVGTSNRINQCSTTDLNMSKGKTFRLNKLYVNYEVWSDPFSLCYTYSEGVEQNDRFFHIRQIEEAWNMKIAGEFNPSWIYVLYESMMQCFNKYAAGFICIGHKPKPFSN